MQPGDDPARDERAARDDRRDGEGRRRGASRAVGQRDPADCRGGGRGEREAGRETDRATYAHSLSLPYPRLSKSAGTRMASAPLLCHDAGAMSVLIVDDHPGFRRIARALLEAEGFEVVGEAADGEEALRVAGELAPTLVLLDVQLPGIDGFEVASKLTAGGGGPDVILVSSRDGSDFGPLVEESGARGFVPKDELSGERLAALLR
jgi:CheY-like chemotaxis protein